MDNSNKNCIIQIKVLFLQQQKNTDIWGCLVLTARDVVCKHAVRQ